MSDMIELDWRGPFTAFEMSSCGESADGISGIYMMMRHLDPGLYIYVGSSKNIGQRLRDHISGNLGLTYYIRRDDAGWHPMEPTKLKDAFWTRVSDLRSETDLAIHAIEQTIFAWAETPHLSMSAAEHDVANLIRRDFSLAILDNTTRIERRSGQEPLGQKTRSKGSKEIVALLAEQPSLVGRLLRS